LLQDFSKRKLWASWARTFKGDSLLHEGLTRGTSPSTRRGQPILGKQAAPAEEDCQARADISAEGEKGIREGRISELTET